MRFFPYVFPVDAWQYPGDAVIPLEEAERIHKVGAYARQWEPWVKDYLIAGVTYTQEGTLFLWSEDEKLALHPGDWLVRFPTGCVSRFPEAQFKELFAQPAREPHIVA